MLTYMQIGTNYIIDLQLSTDQERLTIIRSKHLEERNNRYNKLQLNVVDGA